MPREFFRLRSNFRHRRCFKQFSPARRAEGEESPGSLPGRIHQGAIGAGPEAEAKIVCARTSVRDHGADEGAPTVAIVVVEAGAIDYAIDFQRTVRRVIRRYANFDRVLYAGNVANPSGDDTKASGGAIVLGLFGDLWRHSMSMWFPVGFKVAQKSLLVGQRKMLPNIV